MVENRLSFEDLETILVAFMLLGPAEIVFPVILPIFGPFFTKPEDIVRQDKIKFLYRDFELTILNLTESDNSATSVTIKFSSPRKWWHFFYNPTNALISDIMKICKEEYPQLKFKEYTRSIQENSYSQPTIISYFHDENAYNGNWHYPYQISPLFISKEVFEKKNLSIFHFNANCYLRTKADTIFIKPWWKEHIGYYGKKSD